ncbi:MAG: hypothetical protein WCP46_00980 [Alphaproteobacteria bacterium]
MDATKLTPTLSLQLTDTSVVFTTTENIPFIESVAIPIEMWENINNFVNSKATSQP